MIHWFRSWRYRTYARRGFLVFRLGSQWYVRDPIRILFRLNQEKVSEVLQAVQAQSDLGNYDPSQIDHAYQLMAEAFEIPIGPEGASYQELGELMLVFQEWFEAQKKSTNTSSPSP